MIDNLPCFIQYSHSGNAASPRLVSNREFNLQISFFFRFFFFFFLFSVFGFAFVDVSFCGTRWDFQPVRHVRVMHNANHSILLKLSRVNLRDWIPESSKENMKNIAFHISNKVLYSVWFYISDDVPKLCRNGISPIGAAIMEGAPERFTPLLNEFLPRMSQPDSNKPLNS